MSTIDVKKELRRIEALNQMRRHHRKMDRVHHRRSKQNKLAAWLSPYAKKHGKQGVRQP